MLSKNQIKLITSLQQKKYRTKHNLFVVEGIKGVNEFLNSDFECDTIFCVEDFNITISNSVEKILISEVELKKISSLKTPNKVLGLFKIPEEKPVKNDGLIIALDGINDPGNLGTIIRLCDWFGVQQLICSKNTVDCYNSKVVQSTMGSLSRISISYIDLNSFLDESKLPIFGAFMDGNSVYKEELPNQAILVMGNEANGISKEIEQIITRKITIPQFNENQKAESLNVATATAILLNEFRRG